MCIHMKEQLVLHKNVENSMCVWYCSFNYFSVPKLILIHSMVYIEEVSFCLGCWIKFLIFRLCMYIHAYSQPGSGVIPTSLLWMVECTHLMDGESTLCWVLRMKTPHSDCKGGLNLLWTLQQLSSQHLLLVSPTFLLLRWGLCITCVSCFVKILYIFGPGFNLKTGFHLR